MNQFKTRLQVCDEYGITVKTLNAQLKRHGIILPSGHICPADLELIYRVLGRPNPEPVQAIVASNGQRRFIA